MKLYSADSGVLNATWDSVINITENTKLFTQSFISFDAAVNSSINFATRSKVSTEIFSSSPYKTLLNATGDDGTFNVAEDVEIKFKDGAGIDAEWTSTKSWSKLLNSADILNDLGIFTDNFTTQHPANFPIEFKAFDNFTNYINNFTPSASEAKVPVSSQFNQILAQYDSLIKDSSYKGVNLLQSQDLKVVFNEDRSSFLDIKGVDASANGLGLNIADWNSTAAVQTSLDEIDDAINQLRQHASEFGNYYQIVTAREDFTNSLITVLTEGADDLTLADMNQESANMLALQTRQQLAVNSLSLASQASQSVLKLF